MTRPKLAAALLLALLAAACSSESPKTDAQDDPSPSSSATTAPSPVPPAADACYRLSADDLTRPTNDDEPVSCKRRHTAQTIFVGELDLVVDGHAIAVDSDRAARQVATACPPKLTAYVGGEPQTRDLSRIRVVWFSPTLAEADAGSRWFRCDLVTFGTGDEPASQKGRVPRGVLADEAALDRFGLCGTAAPGTPGFTRVACAQPHTWRAISTIGLEGPKKYPGEKAVREDGDSDCQDDVREREDFALTYTYGWEWPTREQWKAGQRFGYCWAEE